MVFPEAPPRPPFVGPTYEAGNEPQRLAPIWHSVPTAVIGGGVGWAGAQLEAQEWLGRSGG